MSRIKCSKCGKLAHTMVDGKMYCINCTPKLSMPVVIEETMVNEILIDKVERPKPWPAPPPNNECFRPLEKYVETKKSWWKTLFGFLIILN